MNKENPIEQLNPYVPVYQGVIEIPVAIGNTTRKMLAYIPKNARESTAGIIILGSNGTTAQSLLDEGTWRNIADTEENKEKLIVFFLEPQNGIWNTSEEYGKIDGDIDYVNAAAKKAAERYYFCVHEAKMYVTGFKEGGIIANMAVVANPAFYSGLVTVGGCAVAQDYLKKAGSDWYTYLHGYEDFSHKKNICKGAIPLPTWIIHDPKSENNNGENILNYWKHACGTDNKVWQIDPDCQEYRRSSDTDYPLNQEKSAYRVRYSTISGASDNFSMARRIWKDFLYKQRRWMSCPGGDLRTTRDPVRDLHIEYHFENIDGWKREWYVYLPENVRKNPSKKVPLVLALHGYTCNGEIYIGNSEWWQVADKYGFIVIFPSAIPTHVNMPDNGLLPDYVRLPAWNIFQNENLPDELTFFNRLLDKTIAEHSVNTSKIFATGHSWGSMMTQMLGLGMTNRLAAIAPCSGVFFGGAMSKITALDDLNKFNDLELPIWMHIGTEEEWLIQKNPAHENETGRTIEFWLKRNHKSEMIPENWSTCKYQLNGRFKDYIFDKENTAQVRFTQVEYMPHATMPEMSFRIWEQFFSKISK